jgi:hypothetical protein
VSRDDKRQDTASVLRAYFRELDEALSGLPRSRREQLRGEIREHVDEMLTQQPPDSPAELRNLLDRFGRPEDIAAAAMEEEPERRRPSMWTSRTVLISGLSAFLLAGLVTGLALALTSPTPPARSAAATSVARGSATASTAPATPAATVRYTATVTATAGGAPGAQGGGVPGPQPPGSPTASATSRSILPPAAVPPVSGECTEQVVYDADGNVSPLLCQNGGVNVAAWDHYAYANTSNTVLNGSELLRLGPYASPAQVYEAMCYDLANVFLTNPITESTEELAQAYYGWVFAGDNPVQDFENLGCSSPSPTPSSSSPSGTSPTTGSSPTTSSSPTVSASTTSTTSSTTS